jgi:hypothetical protein
MSVTVTKNFPPLASEQVTTKAVMREIGLLARERIIRRTISGTDEHGAAFRPYSASYRALKSRELGGGTVNLQVSGAMLNAITIVDLTDDSVTLGFSS